MNEEPDPTWMTGLIAKRTPDVLTVLSQLLEAGLAKGYCSGNDVATRDMKEPNAIGATFKTLKRLGFRQSDERIKPKYPSQHGRKVHKWMLDEPYKAKEFLRQVRGKLIVVGRFEAQRELF